MLQLLLRCLKYQKINFIKGDVIRMKYLISSIFVVFISFFTTGINIEASTDISNMEPTKAKHIYFDLEFNGYYDAKAGGYIEVFKVENGEVVKEVNMDEYVDRLAKEPNVTKDKSLEYTNNIKESNSGNSVNPLAPSIYYRYTESSNVKRTQYGSRSSIVQKKPGPGSDSFSIGYSASKVHSFNISLGSAEKSAVRSGVSYTWSSSASKLLLY